MQDATEYMLSYSRTAKNSISLTLYVRSYDYVAFYLKFVRAATREELIWYLVQTVRRLCRRMRYAAVTNQLIALLRN